MLKNDRDCLPPSSRIAWWEWGLLALGLSLFAVQCLAVSPQKSAAFDEQYHLAAGYSYLRTGDFRLATTHPPLMGMIGATALLADEHIQLPLDHPAWQTGDRFLFSDVFLWEANANPQQLLVAARRPIILVGLLLVLVLYLWARQLWGVYGALLVLVLAVFDPNLLANARVVTTDLGLSCFLLMASWRLWCWLTSPTLPNLLLTGVAAGLAMGAKYTGLLFWPAALVWLLFYPPRRPVEFKRRALALIGMGFVAYSVVWALYRFDVGVIPDGPLAIPLPALFYWQQLWHTFNRVVDLQTAQLDFFWGEPGYGWWNYFPVAFGLKTPIPSLLLAVLGVWGTLYSRRGYRLLFLGIVPLLFMALGMSGILTIGYRHLLPAIPLLLLQAGGAVALVQKIPGQRQLVAGFISLLLVWLVASVLRVYPHQEAYFNELAGEWPQWSTWLVDSNLDWGQDLPALQQWMAENQVESVNLAYFGKAVPEAYGVTYRPLPGYLRFVQGVELNAYNPYTPEPGWYAISASSLRLGLRQPETVDLYAFFRPLTPVGRAGYSIYLYNVRYPDTMPVQRRVLYGPVAAHLSLTEVGITADPPTSRVQVKWVQSPETVLYPLGTGFVPPSAMRTPAGEANFADVFTLLGYTIGEDTLEQPTAKLDETLHFQLVWRKGPQPMPMPRPTRGYPISMFLHITGADAGEIVAQFDGWRTALRGLEEGDIIVMPAAVDVDGQTPPGVYTIRLGLYSPQSGARLQTSNNDHVILAPIEVRP